ncbi:methylated-DNA--[protein]-cysteine S-methyltransferase [Anatilimnocola sp. NA78]|uniref:methylated-DNA--[protein]-cysteine S-methyltransferase n=1 Tax=Anatilimnocola sp. NA78 TaxID=3415683 RepID=UPI003CE4732A
MLVRLQLAEYDSPLQTLLLVTDEEGVLRALEFADHMERMQRLLRGHYGGYTLENGPAPASIVHALDAYFAGDLRALDSIRVATGGTEFQRAVWQALRAIKPGETKSYGQLAKELGRVSASRAVGAANGANPISIVVPCHRVIGANSKLTGYAGGLPRKNWLLVHERERSARALLFAGGVSWQSH